MSVHEYSMLDTHSDAGGRTVQLGQERKRLMGKSIEGRYESPPAKSPELLAGCDNLGRHSAAAAAAEDRWRPGSYGSLTRPIHLRGIVTAAAAAIVAAAAPSDGRNRKRST